MSIQLLFASGTKAQDVTAVKITMALHDVSLKTALNGIGEASGFKMIFPTDIVEKYKGISLSKETHTVAQILELVLQNTNLDFRQMGQSIVLFKKQKDSSNKVNVPMRAIATLMAPNSDIRIHVTDSIGKPLEGATVSVAGTPGVGQTDQNGDITLIDVPPASSIIISYVGYNSVVIKVGKQKNISIQLHLKTENLADVTSFSNGYQQISKERATGSYTSISAAELSKIPIPNVLQRIEGLVPGVKVDVMAGDRSFDYANTQLAISGGTRTVGTNDYNVTIRGTSTLQGEKFPLVVVDGVISDLDISSFNPDDIENITFLKDAAASSIYGIRAANGVIVITTKKGRATEPKISFNTSINFAGKPDVSYLRMMNSAQELDYEKELVDRGFIMSYNFDPSMYSYSYYPHQGAVLAYQLKNGAITQSAYDAAVDSMSKLSNLSQISKYLLQPASSQSYNLSVNGGTKSSTYYYSASYSKELPNEKRTSGQRLTLTMNNSWTLFKIATLSTNIKGIFFNYKNDGISYQTLFRPGSNVLLPYEMLADANGNGIGYYRTNPDYAASLLASSSNYKDWRYNYLDELNNNNNIQKDNSYTANVQLEVPVFNGLKASALYSNERTFSNSRVYYDPQTYYFRNMINTMYNPSTDVQYAGQQFYISSGGIYSLTNTTVNNYVARGQLSYNRMFKEKHEVNAIGGIEFRQTQEGQGSYTLYGYNTQTGISTAMNYGSGAYVNAIGYSSSIAGAPSQYDKRRRYLSYFGNASYTYDSKYTLSGSVRYDDYNNFGLDRKYRATPLWSSGLKWDIYKEGFMKSVKWVDALSLRATYGVEGNISTTIYPFTYISAASNDGTTGLPASGVYSLADPELKWEKTSVTNIGLDFSLFNRVLSGNVDVYVKRGRDLLYSFPINAAYAGTIGSYYLTRNASSMNGHGVDASLRANIVRRKDWDWSTGLVFSYNTNKIIDKNFDTSAITSSYKSYTPTQISNVNGFPSNELFVFRNAGLDSMGSTLVYDAAGDKIAYNGNVYFKDLKAAGRKNAPYFGSWNTTLRYKNFSLYVLATYQFGGVFLRPTINNYITSYYSLNYDVNADIAKRWKQSGDENKTNVPGLNGTATQVNYSLIRYMYSDANVLSSDYIRLREISLSYSLPSSILPKNIVKGISISATVRNLGMIWKANDQGYDPDFPSSPGYSYSLPPAKSYTFSLNANF
ncbi:hypothetical protein A9P82_01035 [Arachidicoccus ginsenosidimutans]|nr:hypothetical protein A9P82_01035 [Arachidicoccus sp. BS20]